MITHVVIFWTDKSDTTGQAKLLEGVEKLLAEVPQVKSLQYGKPVKNDRGAVDDSFSVAISMYFDNEKDAATYQTHPLHIQFVNDYVKSYAKRFIVYDWA